MEPYGTTPIPSCPGLTLSIVTSAKQLVGSAVVDAAGEARVVRAVPCSAKGVHVLFQAVDPTACAVSPVVETTFR